MDTPIRFRGFRRAFTLVEMLTVIIIIGLLAALILAAVGSARVAARQATIKNDITQLSVALENYRTEYGEYPPDFVGVSLQKPNDPNDANDWRNQARWQARNAVLRHLRKRFPRYAIPGSGIDAQFANFVEQVRLATSDFDQDGVMEGATDPNVGLVISSLTSPVRAMSPSQALVFWLGGLPRFAGSNELTGFSANPANPIAASTVVASRTLPLFEFDVRKLMMDPDDPNVPLALSYGSATARGGNILVPVRYFKPFLDPSAWSVNPRTEPSPFVTRNDDVVPSLYLAALWQLNLMAYADSQTWNSSLPLNLRWINPGRPQIVSAGLDGGFGWVTNATEFPAFPALFPSGGNFAVDSGGGQHLDNVTNFTEKAIIKDDLQQ